MRSLDLFTGYGGIAIGLREYCKPIGYCEIERYAQAIIASRIADGELPIAPIYPDVTKLRGEIDTIDIITGGFPCQDISVAGHGVGLEGKRSGLFFEIIRLAKETRAPFVFLENVPAIRTRGLREVIRAFTEMGYDCRWTCLSAASVGAPHKRERWFLLAHSDSAKLRSSKIRRTSRLSTKSRDNGAKEPMANAKGGNDWTDKTGTGERQVQQPGIGTFEGDVSHTYGIVLQSRLWSWGQKQKFAKITDRSWWEIEPLVGRVVNGCPFRVDRTKALGNGVVPFQVKEAFEKLIGINN